MIDKLDVRVPALTPLRPPVREVYDALRAGERVDGFGVDQHYQVRGDLRPFGIDALIHFTNKHSRDGSHKLEVLETGARSFEQMLGEIESTFDTDPLTLETMRVDLATDVDRVPVSWFRNHMRARFKQWSAQFGELTLEESAMGKREIETLYYGRRPNCVRIYNKTAERRARYVKDFSSLLREKIGPGRSAATVLGFDGVRVSWTGETDLDCDVEIPSFRERFGTDPDQVLTRVERQIAGQRVPEDIDHVWKFRKRLPEFNPFDQLRMIRAPLSPDLALLSGREYLIVLGLRELVREKGRQLAYQDLSRRCVRNANKFFLKYGEFLDIHCADGPGISEADLYDRFRAGVERQLAA